MTTLLRHKADRRAVFFMVIATSLLVIQWMSDSFSWPLFLGSCFMANMVFAMVHNHLHIPMWKNSTLNKLQDYWLTLFYGYPVFAWISTHVMNHHVLNNKPGDDSATWQHTENNNLFSILAYPAVSGGAQQKVNIRFIKKLWNKDRKLALYYLSQAGVLIVFVVGALILDWKKALLYVVIPQQISLNSVLMINYIQHVHADELSKWDHSRNFVGKITNWFMLNNGFHTIHHEKPLQHWSLNAKGHEAIATNINPLLNEKSLSWYLFRVYFLGIFFKQFRTNSMRLARIEKEAKQSTARLEKSVLTEESPALV